MKKIFLQIIACYITSCSFSQTVSKAADTTSGIYKERSVATLNNPQPLYIIDGVIETANNVDSSIIVNITVMKEAEASAIYGAAGAGGVIIITTKKKKSTKR